MKNFGPALLVVLLTGCAASMGGFNTPPDRANPCDLSRPNGDDCEIKITVTPSTDPTNICTIAAPDAVKFVGVTGSNPKWIFWRLDPSSGFVFRDRVGIEFKDPRARFSDGKIVQNTSDLVYRVRNLGKPNATDSPQSWYYGIHLERASDGMRCGFDPLIRNE